MHFSTTSSLLVTSPFFDPPATTSPPPKSQGLQLARRRASVPAALSPSTTTLSASLSPSPSIAETDSTYDLSQASTRDSHESRTKHSLPSPSDFRRLARKVPILNRITTTITQAVPEREEEPVTALPIQRQGQNSSFATLVEVARLAPSEVPPREPSPSAVHNNTQKPSVPSLLYHNLSASTPPATRAAAAPHRRPSLSHFVPPISEEKRRKLTRVPRSDSTSSIGEQLSAAEQAEKAKKMHQTSSRLLRMTDDERPFTRDFKDLFSTLIVSLPLTSHRVRFQKVEHTFTSEEAITNLGSLKFSQSNRMPDPKDPSRIVTTTTTTTFSMAKEMARSVCQKFLDARFIESADGKMDFSSKSAVWQLTPKGMHILHRFCLRNGIQQDHVRSVLESPRNCMKLVILEREVETDRLSHDQATVEVIFRRFVGPQPNAKADASSSDSDSINEYATGLVGVKMLDERRIGDRVYKKSFTGKAAVDWLMDCCSMVDKRETYEVAHLFLEYGLIASVDTFSSNARFQASKGAIYYVSERGQKVAGWMTSPQGSINGDKEKLGRDGVARDSNANRMQVIVKDPALRLLFREYLRHTHCEENLSFYLDVTEFLFNFRAAKKEKSTPKLEFIRETLAAAYSLYNAFLAPGSPCELNIDHSLRIALASRMTRAVGDDDAMIRSLDEVANLFDQAQTTVFKLMATDSVPKFSRDPKYAAVLRERNLDFGSVPHPA